MNPGKVIDPYRSGRAPETGHRLQPTMPEPKLISLPRGQAATSPTRAALRRHRQMPRPRRQNDDVSELHGDPRREALHPGSRPAACSKCSRATSSPRAGNATEVNEALDLCLSCKGCKGDCPVNVDVATYKAEFLHHHLGKKLGDAGDRAMHMHSD